MIAEEIQDEYEIHADIEELSNRQFFENDDIVAKMKKMFLKSMNSTYAVLIK
jgi:hypothetical protein